MIALNQVSGLVVWLSQCHHGLSTDWVFSWEFHGTGFGLNVTPNRFVDLVNERGSTTHNVGSQLDNVELGSEDFLRDYR